MLALAGEIGIDAALIEREVTAEETAAAKDKAKAEAAAKQKAKKPAAAKAVPPTPEPSGSTFATGKVRPSAQWPFPTPMKKGK